ncbi:MarR family transcriptional regulator [Nonomuraea sp. PA05]|uniref:MarR family winged helix-turn-helix transcriptional regulator n=1 Tax=Nonomuraea sp. PA05 TaxID=2604466 RepID=UPI0011D8703B|nr:MarR family transcriptional regulator [Nonomuraea sp. PA05]TYB68373.1 MarR family transcriptional regulator [Nonomuraea sp. PA05]
MTHDDAAPTIGYQLKRVQTALRAAMDAALRAHGLTTPQYACMELLGRRPELSNAELARGTFVTRQSMNVVLHNLEEAGLVSRPASAPSGRALPTRLTEAGERALEAARADVLAIERRMTAGLDQAQAQVLLRQLDAMAEALSRPE